MNRFSLLLLLGALLAAAGCRPDDLVDCSPATPSSPAADSLIQSFNRRNGAPVQTFSLPAGVNPPAADQEVTTAAGATLRFSPAALLLPSGEAPRGTVQLQVREFYTVPDMILGNLPTMLAGSTEPLVSGGMFAIQFSQRGQRLRLAAGSPAAELLLRSPIPAPADTAQQRLYVRRLTSRPDSLGWLATSRRVAAQSLRYRAALPLDSLTWWSIGQPWARYGQTTLARVRVETPATAGTQVFLRPVGVNALVAPSRAAITSAAAAGWSADLPLGTEMVAVVIQAAAGNQFYYGTQRFAVQTNQVVKPTLTPMSEADVVRLVRQL